MENGEWTIADRQTTASLKIRIQAPMAITSSVAEPIKGIFEMDNNTRTNTRHSSTKVERNIGT